jgi:hypothetical protein
MINKLRNIFAEISALPALKVRLDNTDTGKRLYGNFTKRHPKYFIFKQKTIGVGLVCLNDFQDSNAYTQSVNGKNSAAYFSRKALRAGYLFKEIDPEKHRLAILEINRSASSRQGRSMDESYTTDLIQYPKDSHNAYFGVFQENVMVAYLWVVKSGELAVLSRLLGHADHLSNGVMYLLITSYIEQELIKLHDVRFVMYDTFFGAGDGLKLFKTRCGFRPYKVKWLMK